MKKLLESVGAVAVAHRHREEERETLYQVGQSYFIHWQHLADEVEYLTPESQEAAAAWLAGQRMHSAVA